jgi:hypothetical protein
MKCPITGVNIPRFLVCVLAGFITLFVTDFIIHNILLADTYNATKNLWRSPEEMASFFPFMLVGRFIVAGIIAFMFARNYEGAGICNGLHFGLVIGLLIGTLNALPYAWMPIPLILAQAWFIAGLMQGILLGVIYNLIYKPCTK